MELVLVEWEDASFDLDDAPETIRMQTVGWLVKESPYIVLAGESSPDQSYQRSFTSIPRSLVRRIDYLTKKRKAKNVSDL